MAAEELAMIENVSDEPVNVDWASQFFDYAKDISDDEAKILLSKILAGEIKSPNTYNKRTLFALKHIEANEAKWFVEICPFIPESTEALTSSANAFADKAIIGIELASGRSFSMARIVFAA